MDTDKPMSEGLLESFGFKPYSPSFNFDRWDRAFCYCVRDEQGKRLYVHVRLWDNRKYGEAISFDAWAQFKTTEDRVVDLTLHDATGMTPAQVVDWFCKAWSALDCQYYERWDEA